VAHQHPLAEGDVVRLNVITPDGAGQVRLRIDGQPLQPSRQAVSRGDTVEFEVPAALVNDNTITLTFDDIDESRVNWRQYSRLVEAWLIRR
jgi:hypothetical protein